MPGTVLVTGGTGFVAGWCIVELLRRGYDVRTTVRDATREATVRGAVASAIDARERLTILSADLTADEGWADAVAGCDFVLHPASPLRSSTPDDPESFIIPARDGTLRVLQAAVDAGVKRVVLTSACAAASPPPGSTDQNSDESVWTDPTLPSLTSYQRSKAIAERAAWDFLHDHHGPTALTTVLPGAVFGPVLDPGTVGSVQVIGRLLDGGVRMLPRLPFQVVDVRDLADIHLRAMTSPDAAGQRFIAVGDTLWMTEIAAMLRANLGAAAAKVPTRSIPDFAVRVLAHFDPASRVMLASLGRSHRYTSAKARRIMGWSTRPGAETVLDCARSLLKDHVRMSEGTNGNDH